MALALVPLTVLVVLLFALGMSQQGHALSNAIANWLVGWVRTIPLVGGTLADLILRGAKWLSNTFGNIFLRLARKGIQWVSGLAQYVWAASDLFFLWPIKLLTVVRWLLTQEIPRLIAALPGSLTKLVHAARAILASLEGDVAKLWAHLPGTVRDIVKAAVLALLGPFWVLLRELLHAWPKITRAAAHAGGIAAPWVYLPGLRKDVRSLRKEFDKVKGILGVAVFAATLAKVLQVARGCITRGNIGKAARRWCGMDTTWVDSVLLDLLTIASVLSVVEFANDLRAIEDEALSVLAAGIREFPS